MTTPMLSRRGVLLAKQESVYNTYTAPSALLDAMLVEDPDYSAEINTLQRNPSRFDLDQEAYRVGRKVGGIKFSHEWRSNGRSNDGAAAPKLARLLRACGFAQTAIAAAGSGQVGAINADPNNTKNPAFTVAGAGDANFAAPVLYEIAVTTGGASGTAQVSITPDPLSILNGVGGAAQTGVTLTTATAFNLNAGGAFTLTPVWTGNLVLGDKWFVWVYPLGLLYTAVSSGFESLSMDLYYDGMLHKMSGGLGSFEVKAEAGGYAKADFTFMGQYFEPIDSAIPTTAVYENQLPAIVELSDLMIGGYSQTVSEFGWGVKNSVVPRLDANAAEGYSGVRITNRAVDGSINPEAALVADFNFWNKLATGERMLARNKVGQAAGNRIWTMAPSAQLSNLSYGSRDDIRILDGQLSFSRKFGNDSISFLIS